MRGQASLVAAIVFWLMAVAQLLRFVFGVQVRAGGIDVPAWISIPAVTVLGGLGIWL
jgi:hypothetical protein